MNRVHSDAEGVSVPTEGLSGVIAFTPEMLEKSATVTVSLNAFSGYSADLSAPISAAQWGVINGLLEDKEPLYLAAPELLREASEICAILDLHRAETGEEPCFDHEAIGEEVARRHNSLTAAIAKATGAAQ